MTVGRVSSKRSVVVSHVEITSRVDADGVLRICVPLGADEANREVKVVVEPKNVTDSPRPTDRQEWREFVETMAGCISDPSFERPIQGDYEQRSDIFP
jgi:hypothetical protein